MRTISNKYRIVKNYYGIHRIEHYRPIIYWLPWPKRWLRPIYWDRHDELFRYYGYNEIDSEEDAAKHLEKLMKRNTRYNNQQKHGWKVIGTYDTIPIDKRGE